MKISVAHICHGCNGVGVGVRGAAAFWLWNALADWQTTSSIALLMPGQKKFHVQATVTLLFPGGIDVVDVGFSPFQQEES